MSGHSESEAIVESLDWGHFPEFRESVQLCFGKLDTMAAETGDPNPDPAIEAAADCLRRIWANYFDERTASIFTGFAAVQQALFGLELDETSAHRYRDHVLHMFHVFIFGARLLAPLASATDRRDEALERFLKVVAEPETIGTWGGKWTPYDPPKRLFFLWVLMSTFHDIGIPIQHLSSMRDGLNKYLDYFGRDLNEMLTHLEPAVTSQLHYYLSLMAKLFNSTVRIDPKHKGEPTPLFRTP